MNRTMPSEAFQRFAALCVWCVLICLTRTLDSAPSQEQRLGVESIALNSPEVGGKNASLFTLISPDESGVDFINRYDRPERWGKIWRQYFNGTIGTGIALGDVNGDGLPDIFAVGKDSPNALFLNQGDFRFRDVTEMAGVAGGEGFGAGASFVDIDNDGDLDLYVCYVGYVNELFINDGAGTFVESAAEWGLDLNTGSNAPSFADYDRDGDLDLYLQLNFLASSGLAEGMPDLLLRNEGDEFVDVTKEAGIMGNGQGHIALWSDYNDDGWPDIYVTNDFRPADKLYINNGDGTFTNRIKGILAAAPYSAMGADVGDPNNDGLRDLIVAEMMPRDRAYRHRTTAPLSANLFGISKETISQYMQNMFSVNLGNATYGEFGYYSGLQASDWTWASRFVDLDNDGLQDVFFTTGMARAFHDGDLGIKMLKAKTLRSRVALFQRSEPLFERNLAFKNVGNLQFQEVGSDWGLDLKGVSFGAAFADFDQDGDLDIVVGNWKEKLSLYRNNSTAGQRLSIRLVGAGGNRFGVGSRVLIRSREGLQTRELILMRGYMGGG